jgi:hypothetical protein
MLIAGAWLDSASGAGVEIPGRDGDRRDPASKRPMDRAVQASDESFLRRLQTEQHQPEFSLEGM